MLNAGAAGLLVPAGLEHETRGAKLILENQHDTRRTPSAVQPEARCRCGGLERGTEPQKQALAGDSPAARLGAHAPLPPRKSKQVTASAGWPVKDSPWCVTLLQTAWCF